MLFKHAKTINTESTLSFVQRSLVRVSCLLILALSVSVSTASADTKSWALDKPLTPYVANYSVGNDVIEAGQAVVELSNTKNNEWRYSLTTEPTGLFKLAGKGYVQETSTFQISEADNAPIIRPQRYKFRQDNQKKRAVDATFNWSQQQLYYQRGDQSSTSELNADTLDRMTMTVAMMSTLTPDFESFTLAVFDGGRIKEVELVNEGTETIKTTLGDVETVLVRTRNVAGSSRETLTWFAPSLNNLPVRIEQLKRGELVARLSVRQYTPK